MAKLARLALTTFVSLLFVFLWLAAGNPDPFGPWIAALAQAPCGANPVVCENSKPGNADFEVSGAGGSTIQGFATDISVNVGHTINFKIDAPGATSYSIAIYRLGYYSGAGARRIATIAPSAPPDQPDCLTDLTTGLVDCGNWAVSASWAVPVDAVSGVYIAKLSRPDNGEASHIVFIVRDDSRTADVLVQTSDTTWQAYNRYGGASLYCADTNGVSNAGSAYANSCGLRATKVSYNRPFDTRGHSPQSFLFSAEYPMLRFLEANGYDVKYWAGVDTDRRAADLVGASRPKVFLSSGHDEYWSGGQRAGVEAARNAGVNLAFFSGNEVYWKTRYEPSTASTDAATSNPAYRTLVAYKDTLAGVKLDPKPNVATGTWRDTRFAPPTADGGRPENALIGSMWTVNSGTSAISVPPAMANLRIWRNTRIATQGGGTLAPSSLGYEWGEDLDNGSRPAGVIHLSSTTVAGVEKIVDFGATVANGTATHSLTLYRHASGALVFGASTVQWGWGLDAVHDDHAQSQPSHTPDLAMQQATLNLLADMGAQPASRQSGLVGSEASVDALPPTTVIASPAAGATVGSGDRVTIAGTASDNGGGAVAGVEVSVDGGATWRAARGTTAWTFEWLPGAIGSATIRVRATDDSGNQDPAGVSRAVVITAGRCPCPSIWPASAIPAVLETDDPNPVELGLKFRSDIDGFVKGVRFYKGVGNSGTHIGNLWASNGTLLASATFAGETSSGWQQVLFDQPVDIDANTLYVVSYHTNVGQYSSSGGYFSTLGVDAPPLHALTTGVAGGNGVYAYGATGFPTQTFNATNYWVDVVFDSTPDTTKPVIADVTATAADSTTALVSWSTNEAATSVVEYSTDSTFPPAQTGSVADLSFTLTHRVRITNLRANTRYHFRLKSTDRAGNQGTWPPPGTPQPGPGGTPPPPPEFTTPKPTLHDTTVADFSAGIPTSVHVAEAGDGEIILAPAAVAEFSGTALPAGWSETIWSDGGSSNVGGGRLTVDGARVVRDQAEPLAGHSVEFVATFTGDPYQHSGLGQTLATSFEPLALFSTSWIDIDGTPRAGGSLAVRSSVGDGSEMSTNLGPSFFNAPHRYRIDWQPAAVIYSVDGAQVASHAISIAGPMRPVAASDFNAFSGTITVDWVRMSPYAAAGSFLSRVFDASSVVDWADIRWTAAVPDGTTLSISVRTGMSALPDDTWTAFVPIAAPRLLGIRSRYIQYRAELTSSLPDRTPELLDLVIGSTNPTLTAADDQASVPENGLHVFPASGAGSLIANDTDSFAAAALRVVSVTAPAHGAASVGADGTVTYTPATNYHGTDSFGYTVSDGTLTANATVAIDVTGNIAPIANADRFDVDEDGTLTVVAASGLLGNDIDAEHDPLTVRLVSPPAHGALALSADGSFSYTPAENFAGTDEFTYKANDGFDDSAAAAAVQISVAAVNDRPFFTKGADQVVLEDAGPRTVVGWATGVSAGAPSESAQALNFIVDTTNSTLFAAGPAISPDGTLSYTPAPNANGSAVVTVRLHDNGGTPGVDTSDPQTFGIVVTAVNDAPSFVKGADQSVGEDAGPQSVASWATGISAGPADESAQALSFAVVTNTNPSLFAAGPAVSANGTLTYTPAANANGSATITLRLTDNGGIANSGVDTSASQTFVITVAARNDAPSFVKGADQTVLEDAGPRTVAGWATSLNAGAPDEAGQLLDFIVTTSNDPLFSVRPAIAPNGTLTFTPAVNANGTATVTVRLHDNGGIAGGGVDTSAPQTFLITVTPVNDAPVALGDQAATTQGVAVTIPVLANDSDVDSIGLSVVNVVATANATVVVNADGTVTYTPVSAFLGGDSFTYRAQDALGGTSDAATVTVVVGLKTTTAAATPNVPVATGTSAVPADPIQTSVTSPVAATVSMTSGVVSESNPPADFMLLNQQVNITVAASNGTEVVTSLANPFRLTFTLDASTIPASETIDSIQILRNDQVLTECPGATAIPAGQDPCISSRTALAGADAGDFQFTVLATHASRWNFGVRRQLTQPSATNDRYTTTGLAAFSVPAPGVLGNDLAKNAMSAALVTAPAASSFTLNANGGFTFTPASCADVSFTYTATDKNGTSNVATATIAIQCAPVAVDDAFSTAEDTPISGNVLGNDTRDPQAGALQAVKVGGPANGSVTVNGDGSFTYTPAANYNGADSFTYKVNDGALDSAPATVRLTITPVNDPPTISNVGDQTSTGGAVGPLAVTVGDVEDATGASLTLTAGSSNPALTTIALGGSSGTNRTVTVTPVAGQTGQATITLTVSDGNGGTAQDTFVLTVSSAQVAPTISLASSATTATTYGQSITYTSTVSGSKGTATGTVTFYDGNFALGPAVTLDATGKASLATTTTPAGTRAITAVYSGDSKYTSITSAPITQTVNKAAATSTLTLSAVQKQYSDTVGATVTVSPVDAAQSVTFKSGTRVLGTYDVVGGRAVVNVPMLNVTLGANMVTAVFNQTVANYTVPSPVKPITIAVEDATVAYASSTDVIICGSCANTVTLTATVKDINVTNPLGDPEPGDIGNANVSFVNRATGLTIGTVKVVASATDARIGTATFSWPITIAPGSSQTFTIGMVVGSFYRNSTTDNVTVKITKQ